MDPAKLARAYNNSILLMLGVPYGMMAVVGVMIYRHLRNRAVQQQLLAASMRSPEPSLPTAPLGERTCSILSTDADS